MNLGGAELLILVGLAVLVFGAGWLPKAARNLGKAKVEFDEVQRQLNETKESFVEATGVKELESTMRKANQVMNTSPQKLMKDAAKSAVTGSGAASAAAAASPVQDDVIEDAEIVSEATTEARTDDADASTAATEDTININLDE
jgi:Sec-independent protein translocase protein TatA